MTASDSGLAPLRLRLQVPPGPAHRGEPVPVRVEVENTGASPVPCVGVLDGSESGLRYPRWAPVVRRGSETVARPGPVEDPLVGPLRRADVVTLSPGGTFDPTSAEGGRAYLPLSTFAAFRPAAPGRYTFELALDTREPEPERWLGRFGQGTDAERAGLLMAVRRIPAVLLVATVDVDVG
ncbi:hypothetical protein [Motilibacter deserti]|uniref:Uncharacterized protein n=1 Tax=Motilibacter deserti TaxID=2714956 RepID=A0ABX0GX88_9ACTN|nr:hypothetical protein [Motilibacter deserti]NHC14325.1 hypothetical protein [Motilibacter deserti]